MKIKNKITKKQIKAYITYQLIALNIFILAIAACHILTIDYTSEYRPRAYINQVEAKTPEKEIGKIAWIMDEVRKAGLDPLEAAVIIYGESRGNVDAYNVNTNGSADLGIWQINTLHIDSGSITLQCATDIKCSTEWAIEKRLNDGNWKSWYAARAYGIR
jgi:hypothetical protein